MRTHTVAILALFAGACLSLPALAAPCYLIIDSGDRVIYRDLVPPFDLSLTPSPARASMRQKGQLLLVAEFEDCRAVGYISTATGGTTASVDEIVMQLRPAALTSIGSPGGVSGSGSPVSTSGYTVGNIYR